MKLGTLETEVNLLGRRDAFHCAAVLVFCTEELQGGDSVRFDDNTYKTVVKCDREHRHAVADPFVGKIELGQMFWAVLIPDRTKNLTHHFDLNFDDIPAPAAIAPAPVIAMDKDKLKTEVAKLSNFVAPAAKKEKKKKQSVADMLKAAMEKGKGQGEAVVAPEPAPAPVITPQEAVNAIAPEVLSKALEDFHNEKLQAEQEKLDAIQKQIEEKQKELEELKDEADDYDYDDGCRGCN